MCGLFGFSIYGSRLKNASDLTNSLAEESAIRGTDATGVAYSQDSKITILKEPKSTYSLEFKHPDDIKGLIGHTRHATQGSEKQNYNNHPFWGKCADGKFALAHNGVLMNENALRKKYNLQQTKIETDSYVAVQLIEHKKKLSMDSLKFMAEELVGSFSFSILDEEGNIYLVKGDSPLYIIHFPKLKLYVYASTEEILWKALINTPLFKQLKENEFEEVSIHDGDILKICADGKLIYDRFDYTDYTDYGCYKWWNYLPQSKTEVQNQYLEDLKAFASTQGYDPDYIDNLYDEGFSLEEIEDFLYANDYLEV